MVKHLCAFESLESLETLDLRGNPPIDTVNFDRAKLLNLSFLDMPITTNLVLDDAELGPYASEWLLYQAWPINASLVGVRFSNGNPRELITDTSRLEHLTIDQHLYDSYSDEIDRFASEEGNTLTVISYGDSNRDGFFNSSDLVLVFDAGEYDDGIAENSYWTTGDWNSDGDFDSSDLVIAFQTGQYEAEAAVVAVPEPSAMVLLLLGLSVLRRFKKLGL